MEEKKVIDQAKTDRLRKISAGIVAATAAIWALWDIIPAINAGRGDTLSENIRDWSRNMWSIPLIWGALTGHFFVNIGQPTQYTKFFLILCGIAVAAILTNVATHFLIGQVPLWGRIAALVFGIVLGIALWSQNP